MTSLKLYNTQSRQKEELKPLKENHVHIYTCGPTVYDFAHIGNFRTYIFEDLLRRTIQFLGMKVTQVMNITDVDDKTIKGAVKKNISLEEFVEPYKKAFFEDLATINIQPAEHYPCATDYIPEMIGMIETLLSKGYAYKGNDGSIYYAIKKFPNYGCLSHLKLDELESGASERVAVDEYDKENASDFVLWKAYDEARDGPIYWESPFGKGRPGWHLECSAMAIKILGDTLDIHCGGVDNMFPHHENEIAQSEACSGKRFVQLWMHSEHLIVDNKKMSKSLGNFYTLRNLLDKGFNGKQIRYLLLQTHYKTQLNFTFEGLNGAKESLQRINDFIYRLQQIHEEKESTAANEILETAKNAFANSLSDDLNISEALASLFDLIRQGNSLCDQQRIGKQEAQKFLQTLHDFNEVLAVFDFEQNSTEIPSEVAEALQKRIDARKEKNWSLADELRDFITSKGYEIEDSSTGARLKKL